MFTTSQLPNTTELEPWPQIDRNSSNPDFLISSLTRKDLALHCRCIAYELILDVVIGEVHSNWFPTKIKCCWVGGWLLHLGSWPSCCWLYWSFPPPNGWYLPVRTFTKISFNRKGMDLCKRKSERFWSENGGRRHSWSNGDEGEWRGGSGFRTKA